MNFFNQRTIPLKVEVYKGSIATKNECLLGTDALIAIELIEHLAKDDLKEMPHVIFEYMKPKLAIFTTPNKEANVLFPNLEGFRHWDHKFEWTRKEFEMWAKDICKRFPEYSVQFYQIGEGPLDKKQLNFGGVSQCAIFLSKEFLDIVNTYKTNTIDQTTSNISKEETSVYESIDDLGMKNQKLGEQVESNEPNNKIQIKELEANSMIQSNLSAYSKDNEYTLIFDVDYPFTPDNRSDKQKIIDESKYHINRMSRIEKYIDEERNVSIIPLAILFDFVFPLTKSRNQLRQVLLKEGYKVLDNDFIEIFLEEDEEDKLDSSDDYSESEDNMDLTRHIPITEPDMWD